MLIFLKEDVCEPPKYLLEGKYDSYFTLRLLFKLCFFFSHIPPGPTEVQLLMKEFIRWLNSVETLSLHPIRFAALAHYKLVYIHPFTDGNGRTSRLLMNLVINILKNYVQQMAVTLNCMIDSNASWIPSCYNSEAR